MEACPRLRALGVDVGYRLDPTVFAPLTNLTTLRLEWTKGYVENPGAPANDPFTLVGQTDEQYRANGWDLSALSSLKSLRNLGLIRPEGLHKTDSFCMLTALEVLDLSEWKEIRNSDALESLRLLTNLKSLDLAGAENLTDVRCLASLAPTLRHLFLGDCFSLGSVAGIEALTKLETLDLGECAMDHGGAPLGRRRAAPRARKSRAVDPLRCV